MRILDKNTDFYDYLQNVYRDDSVTFDRTDSFMVTKEIMCEHLDYYWHSHEKAPNRLVLLQVCNTFWLFAVKITKINDYGRARNYIINLLHTWKDYDLPRCLIQLQVISFKWNLKMMLDKRGFAFYDEVVPTSDSDLQKILRAIKDKDYEVKSTINSHRIYYDTKGYGPQKYVEKHIPLLMACGIGNLVDPLDIFLALEEYFSLEKQSSERSESIGLTNEEKIENHGFDKKFSFRGK